MECSFRHQFSCVFDVCINKTLNIYAIRLILISVSLIQSDFTLVRTLLNIFLALMISFENQIDWSRDP